MEEVKQKLLEGFKDIQQFIQVNWKTALNNGSIVLRIALWSVEIKIPVFFESPSYYKNLNKISEWNNNNCYELDFDSTI